MDLLFHEHGERVKIKNTATCPTSRAFTNRSLPDGGQLDYQEYAVTNVVFFEQWPKK